ncbi:MAG: hypothetical protein PHN75_12400 [Syntrophales bacterium]|nr:hypothetical protein [Syntrophales bacterium]
MKQRIGHIVWMSAIDAFVMFAMLIVSLVLPAHGEQTQLIPQEVHVQLDSQIKSYIDWYEAKHCNAEPGSACRGTEYRKARKFCIGDIDGDGKNDIAVLYTIESLCCGNNYYFFLATFLNRGTNFEFMASEKIGGKGERSVAFDTIKNRLILLTTDEYLPDDPMCCPSGKGSTTYTLENGKLIERNRIGEKSVSPLERYRRGSERIQPFIDEELKRGLK